MSKVWTDIQNLLKAPIVGQMDAVQLWVLIGVVIIALASWAFILRHIKLAATEI